MRDDHIEMVETQDLLQHVLVTFRQLRHSPFPGRGIDDLRPGIHDQDPDCREALTFGNRGAEVVHPEDCAMGHFPFGIDGARGNQHQIGDQTEVLGVSVGAWPRSDHDQVDATFFLGLKERQKPFDALGWREDR